MKMEEYKARFFESHADGSVQCQVCPRHCRIADGKTGFCAVRKNIGGQLYSLAYGYPTALQIDPIEKKPLQHYLPGTRTFSVGAFGCNLNCEFCQNYHLSRAEYNPRKYYQYYSPEALVALVKRHGCESISFTYNEPTVWIEYVMDCLQLARDAGLGTVLVSNAFIDLDAARVLYPLADAMNVDVKGETEAFYNEMCHAQLAPVTAACEFYKHEIHGDIELTNLVIPGKNSSREMVDLFLNWVETRMGKDTPLHFTAYHPAHHYHDSPRTPLPMLEEIQAYAIFQGFPNVYLGNLC